ncbi:UPF0193 protein EVG1 homolog [Pectinophora gossypiella]|uniref:UPF0193 protein EVG1 homolog n=1 Tax=Pectinophora gossypiella TaxID=13191 RepID=UPI00214E902B|nr:UPF0193 protein EVG1 homolog [Pectinophora gossypiella]
MQQPDSDGFVNITWPSRTIPHGGIFHTRRVEPSTHQQEFLKVLLEESKLTIQQRRDTALKLREQEKKQIPIAVEMPMVRPRTSKRRSLSAIRESGIYDMDPYKPLKRGEDREKLKEHLANTMAYGDSPEQVPPPPPRIPKPTPKIPTEKEKWNDLLTQIRERAEWLAEMEDLGQAEPYREVIHEQIAERLRALDALGIDSECSSVRSAFSTTRSREPPTARSQASDKNKGSAKSDKSTKSRGSKPDQTRTTPALPQEKQKSARSSGRSRAKNREKEENVAAYDRLTPLQYSPRRRV